MNTPEKRKQVMDQVYLGHRIHFNWPLLIIIGWLSIMLYGVLNKNNECLIPSPTLYGEHQE